MVAVKKLNMLVANNQPVLEVKLLGAEKISKFKDLRPLKNCDSEARRLDQSIFKKAVLVVCSWYVLVST